MEKIVAALSYNRDYLHTRRNVVGRSAAAVSAAHSSISDPNLEGDLDTRARTLALYSAAVRPVPPWPKRRSI